MYVFLVLALPLGFLALYIKAYPRIEEATTKRTFLLGALSFIPLILVARLLGAIVPTAPGTLWGIFHELADRILPFAAFPALLYMVFYRIDERLPPGAATRRLTAFYAGALAPIGIFETIRVWGSADPYELFLVPAIMAACVLAMPPLVIMVRDGYGARLVLVILAGTGACLVLAAIPLLFLIRLGLLAWFLTACAGALAWSLAYPELLRNPGPEPQ